MIKALSNILKKALDRRAQVRPEEAPIYESLAMTEELREALFPTTPQMVSAIFERPAPARSAPDAPAAPALPTADRGFPFL